MAENHYSRGHNTWWVAGADFAFLTLNSGLAIYRTNGDLASILFVAGTYLSLLLLFRCLRDYERAPPGSSETERARRAVWPLPTVLTHAFVWKVAAVMPWAVAATAVWALAVATTVSGFYALFPFVTISYLAPCSSSPASAPTSGRRRGRRPESGRGSPCGRSPRCSRSGSRGRWPP
ncbi:unnamed protein product [Urochloa humidicola]